MFCLISLYQDNFYLHWWQSTSAHPVSCGVPEESILVPLLFLIMYYPCVTSSPSTIVRIVFMQTMQFSSTFLLILMILVDWLGFYVCILSYITNINFSTNNIGVEINEKHIVITKLDHNRSQKSSLQNWTQKLCRRPLSNVM